MPTCLDLIKDALIWRGVLDPGREPEPGDANGGLSVLKGIYQTIARQVSLTPVTISADYTAGENERVNNTGATPFVVTLPETITPDGEDERVPFDRSVIQIAGSGSGAYLYDAKQADWIKIESLILTSEAPLAVSYYNGLVARLTSELRYPGYPIDPTAERQALSFKSQMTGRWDVERPVAEPSYF